MGYGDFKMKPDIRITFYGNPRILSGKSFRASIIFFKSQVFRQIAQSMKFRETRN